MLSLAKWLGGLLMTLLLMLALAVLFLPRMIDPNDYRDEIEQLALEQTGRELRLEGNLAISVFPWLGIQTEGLSFSQPDAIGGQMVAVRRAQLRLRLLPLLSKRLEVDTVVLESPQLSLITLADGTNSFTGLGGADNETATGTTDARLTPVALVIQGLEITDAELLWDDRSTGQKYQLKAFNFTSGNLLADELADIELSGQVVDAASPAAISLQLDGSGRIDVDNLRLELRDVQSDLAQSGQSLEVAFAALDYDQTSGLQLADISLSAELAVAGLPGDESELTPVSLEGRLGAMHYTLADGDSPIVVQELNATVELEERDFRLSIPSASVGLDSGMVTMPSLAITSKDLRVDILRPRATSLFDRPRFTGELKAPVFDAMALLTDLQIDYQPVEADALSAVGLTTSFDASIDSLTLRELKLSLDQSTLGGEIAIDNFADPAVAFDLNLDQLNLDKYLPEAEQGGSDQAVSGAEALAVPMAALKQVNANGRFRANSLVSGGLQLDDVDVQVVSGNGTLSITPSAKLYDGKMAGKLDFTETTDGGTLSVKHDIDLVSLAKLLTAADITDQLSGVGALGLDLTVVEKDGVQSNSGTIKLLAKDGTIKGIDVKKMLDQGYASYKKLRGRDEASEPNDTDQAEPAAEQGENRASDETGFAEMAGTFKLNNLQINNNDFVLNAPLFRIAGEGQIDIATQTLSYLLRVSVVNSTSGQGGESLDKLRGITIPIRLSGSLSSPSYSLDMQALYQGLIKRELDEKKADYLEEKLGIEDAEDLSTKEVLQRALIERLNRKSRREQEEHESAEPVPYEQTGDGPQTQDERTPSQPVPYEETNNDPAPQESGNNDVIPDVYSDPNRPDVTQTGESEQGGDQADDEALEEDPQSAEDQLKEDLGRKLLESIFK